MGFETILVSVADIDFAATRFRISSQTKSTDLKKSIRSIGLLFQPTLLRYNGRLCIVSGFQRVKAIIELGHDTIPATVLPEDSDPLTCARMAIADNAYGRELNPVELARAYSLLLFAAGSIEAVSHEAKFLHIPYHPIRIAKNLRILDMPPSLQDCLRDNLISLSIALQLVAMTTEDLEAFVNVCNRFKPGLNRQKEILAMATDTASRDDLSFREVLVRALAEEEPVDSQLPLPLRFIRMIDRLRNFRYPSIVAAERHFKQAVAALQPGSGIQLDAPRHFENGVYRLHLIFSNAKELQQRKKEMARLADHSDIHTLFQ